MKHKHADIASAWMQDTTRVVQIEISENVWMDDPSPQWREEENYRFKPEPKPDVVEYYYAGNNALVYVRKDQDPEVAATFDGETRELKSVRRIGSPCPVKMEAVLREYRVAAQSLYWADRFLEALRND